jgi:hypothetical protein
MTLRRYSRLGGGSFAALWLPLALAAAAPASAQAPGEAGAPSPDTADSDEELSESKVEPLYGNINPFYGNISPFWGNISPFYGDFSAFWGNINPFEENTIPLYGNFSPFWGNTHRLTQPTLSLAPAWGDIRPFWEQVGARVKETNAAWGASDFLTVAEGLRGIVAQSAATWGPVVTAVTGKDFDSGFADPLLARYGIDLDNPAALAALSPGQRGEFFLAWYDGLMAFSGRDRPDHWMVTANWTPALTQQQGGGASTVVGILDSHPGGSLDLSHRIIRATGYAGSGDGHGAGVASLIVAAHDGEGVMGIAPRAGVAIHNPFDETRTASWADVREGIVALKARNASIVNASLGEAGTVLPADWNKVFADAEVKAHKGSTVYVIAAGNEGLAQSANIEWGGAAGTHFLLVGSVDPAGNISSFSNRPGDACLLVDGVCGASGKLMNRFITAPGELILVSDGRGGIVRRSGTSFAAPMVSGAIALLHDRWPWLAKDPAATVEIILRSARDAGAPGVDPVYGAGLLDITAAQSPLDFNSLLFYKVRNGIAVKEPLAKLRVKGLDSSWEASGVYFTLFERVGKSYRDFVVPMSSLLSGTVRTAFGSREEFQHYLTQRLTDFINKGDRGAFTDVASYTSPDRGGWRMSVASQNPVAYLTERGGAVPHSAFTAAAPGGTFALSAGYGAGAMVLAGQRGFAMTSDFAGDGGVNPLLSLASGGGFFNSEIALAERTRLSIGFTERRLAPARDLSRELFERAFIPAENLRADALNLRVNHDFAPGTGLSLNYTVLRESNALLAVQAHNGLLEGGSRSEALTFGATADLGAGLTLAASASAGRTRTPDEGQQLVTSGPGVLTSAFAVSATKNGVVGSQDRLRLSFTQPMHIESGRMKLQAAQVTDRATGEIGVVANEFAITGKSRVHTGELLYAAPLQDGRGEFSLFGRATFGAASDYRTGFASGVRVRLEM